MALRYFISLGAWCQTTYQIKNHGLPLLSSVFDWLATPWAAIANILETNGELFGKAFHLSENCDSMQCAHYGCLYHHEFARGSDGMPIVLGHTGFEIHNKLLKKHLKMLAALESCEGDEVVFVRYGGAVQDPIAWPYKYDDSRFSEDELNSLLALLKGIFQRWSRNFGPFVKMDFLMREMIQNDEEKEPRARVQGEGCA